MFDKRTPLAFVLAGLFLASTAVPTAAAEPPSDPREIDTGNDFVDCLVTHLFNGWFIGNCQPQTTTSASTSGDTVDCLYEHLKNDWFVGNCLN